MPPIVHSLKITDRNINILVFFRRMEVYGHWFKIFPLTLLLQWHVYCHSNKWKSVDSDVGGIRGILWQHFERGCSVVAAASFMLAIPDLWQHFERDYSVVVAASLCSRYPTYGNTSSVTTVLWPRPALCSRCPTYGNTSSAATMLWQRPVLCSRYPTYGNTSSAVHNVVADKRRTSR